MDLLTARNEKNNDIFGSVIFTMNVYVQKETCLKLKHRRGERAGKTRRRTNLEGRH